MRENILIAMSAVAPMFLIIALGYFIRSRNWVDASDLRKFNLLGFRLFLPCHLFQSIYNSSGWKESFNLPLALATVTSILSIFLLAIACTLLIEKKPDYQSVLIQSIFRSNFILLGLPLVSAVSSGFGSDAYIPMMFAIVIPLFNVLAVVLLEVFYDRKASPLQILLKILKNPLVIGASLALLIKFLQIPLDKVPPLVSAVSSLGEIAAPFLLFTLGASFQISSMRKNKFQILYALLGRLVCAPMVALLIGYLFGLDGGRLSILLSVFIAPTATTTYTMTQQMGGDTDLASGIILASTVCSCFTMSIWIVFLRQFVLQI